MSDDGTPAESGRGRTSRDKTRKNTSITSEIPRITTFTIILVVIFIASSIALLGVINLSIVREYFGGEAFLWVLRAGLGIMILTFVIYLVYGEMTHLRHLKKAIMEIEEKNRSLGVLLDAGRVIGSTLMLDHVLTRFLGFCLAETGADYGALYVVGEEHGVLELNTGEGFELDKMAVRRVEPGRGAVGDAASLKRNTSRVEKLELDDENNAFRGAVELLSQFIMPIMAGDEVVGVVALGNSERHFYSDEEAMLLKGLGEFAGLSIINANLYEKVSDSLEELARQRGITDMMLENMMAGVIIADREGRIEVFNNEVQRLTGYKAKDILGGTLMPELTLEENPFGPLEQGMMEVLKNALMIKEGEAVVLKKDKTLLPIDYRIYPLTNEEEVVGVVAVIAETKGFARDSSRRGEVDYTIMLRSLGARIERLYAYPVSRAIEGINTMRAEDFPNYRDEIVGELKEGSAALLGLLEDVEQYLTCVSVREWDTQVAVEPAELAGEAVERIIRSTEAEGVVILINLNDLPPVFGYRKMMRTALEEVIENAVMSAVDSDKKVQVTGVHVGDFVRIGVRDKGQGIKNLNHRYLYLPFFTTREGRSGLGLAIVKRIMQHLGGRFGVEEMDEGVVFFLEFPTSKVPLSEKP
ncbi:MAG: GAF domain-containing protein [Actinobacteria bacterium]|nr:GAF domain-containing protein [Actinomycetota bacterium]